MQPALFGAVVVCCSDSAGELNTANQLKEHVPLVSTAVLQNYRALRFARGAPRSEGVVVRNALRNVLATPIVEGQFGDDSDGQRLCVDVDSVRRCNRIYIYIFSSRLPGKALQVDVDEAQNPKLNDTKP